MELIRENIECEQLLNENTADTVVKKEYIIPDTHPDIFKMLMLDVKSSIISKEVMQDKVYVEGQIEYDVMYLAKEEEKTGVYSVTYNDKFSNYIPITGAMAKMLCESDCYIEHMDAAKVNDRKVSIEGIIKIKSEVYKNYNFEVVKGIDESENIQLLKSPTSIDKIVGNSTADLISKSHIQIPMDKPQIGSVLKCDVNIHKKEVKVIEGKINLSAFTLIELLYRGKDTNEVVYVKDDVFISKEIEFDGASSIMTNYTDFRVDAMEFSIKEDDLGENRIIDVEALVKATTKLMSKEEIDSIEDAYSPDVMIEMKKKQYDLNVIHGQNSCETIVKENVEIDPEVPKPTEIVMTTGKVCVTDKRLVEDKMLVEGLVNVDIMYKSRDLENYIVTIKEELPFTCAIDILGCKINMQCIARAFLETLEASVEGNTIAVKAVVQVSGKVSYVTKKDFLIDVIPMENDFPKKKSSISIYVVQPGDSLWKIAKKYFTTVDILVKLNDIEDMNVIKPGDKLLIPGRAVI